MKKVTKSILLTLVLALSLLPTYALAQEETTPVNQVEQGVENIKNQAPNVQAPEINPPEVKTETTTVESDTTIVENPAPTTDGAQNADAGGFFQRYGLYIIIALVVILILFLLLGGRNKTTKEVYVEKEYDTENPRANTHIHQSDEPSQDRDSHLDTDQDPRK